MKKILIVVADYYPSISQNLLYTSKKYLGNKYNIKKIFAPGAFEIPFLISKNIKKFDAFIALGCIIRGETPHYDYISRAIHYGLMKISIENKKPIGNGVLTCLNKKQAIKRKNKGQEAAKAVHYLLTNGIKK